MRTGSPGTVLIVIRGNSGSGKTSVAHAVRDAYGRRGMALISQDVVRRDILREPDRAGGVNIGLIDVMCRHALDAGHHVVLEGILAASRYGAMLNALRRDHLGTTRFYYFDISLEETLRRHDTRPQRDLFSAEQMRRWYVERDALDGHDIVVGEDSSLEETVRRVLRDAGLPIGPPPV
ncbi:AAA family ATPase [Nonomuraea rhodomycinica]|uniref:Kinase n=1 Tax=Nonomuraea rhodomycinica TaxID=1712872 RepID=A0A7Y6M8K2_9ACTN|nr:AAA family ATPase [Nonomuraea rhodomycinica]NUW39213.1 kinase [Nonomuraea rhodomycinica]